MEGAPYHEDQSSSLICGFSALSRGREHIVRLILTIVSSVSCHWRSGFRCPIFIATTPSADSFKFQLDWTWEQLFPEVLWFAHSVYTHYSSQSHERCVYFVLNWPIYMRRIVAHFTIRHWSNYLGNLTGIRRFVRCWGTKQFTRPFSSKLGHLFQPTPAFERTLCVLSSTNPQSVLVERRLIKKQSAVENER